MNDPLFKRLQHLFRDGASSRSVEVYAGVAVGSLRGPRDDNQDRAAVAHIRQSEPVDDFLIAVVCDGMGGMRDGGLAAATAISAFIANIASSGDTLDTRMLSAINSANAAVHDALKGAGGATLTAVAVPRMGNAWAVHAGDTRLYGYRTGGELDLITQDDTVQGIVQANALVKNEDDLDNRLLQFVGIGASFEPHIHRVAGGTDYCWLITSDGAHSIGRKLLHNITLNARSAGDLVRKIVFVADAAAVGDNASVAAISPADFERSPPYSEGLSLTVWTATQDLELWITGSSGAVQEEQQPAMRQSTAALRDEGRQAGRRKRVKGDTQSVPGRKSARPGSKAPQLKISFSDSDEEKT